MSIFAIVMSVVVIGSIVAIGYGIIKGYLMQIEFFEDRY